MELPELIVRVRGTQSVQDFAKDLGVTRQAVYMWQSGAAKPSAKILARLGIRKDYTLTDEQTA